MRVSIFLVIYLSANKKSHPGSGTFYWFNECVPKHDGMRSLPKTEG